MRRIPRLGVSLPHFGPYVGPEGTVAVAQAAERLGFHSVSVTERLLTPVRADWDNAAGLPESYVWEPLELLTWVAAHTERIRLGTGIVDAIFQPPIVLARRLATIDQLSRGRLDLGIGQGGGGTAETSYLIPEEFAAAGVPIRRRGRGFEEHVAAMRACWAPDPVEYDGEFYRIPRSSVGPKPFAGTIPLFLGALARPAVERAARIGDGLVLAVVDWDAASDQVRWYRDAGGTGTVVMRTYQQYPTAETEPGTFVDTVLADAERAAATGADELHFGLDFPPVHPDHQGVLLEALAKTAEL